MSSQTLNTMTSDFKVLDLLGRINDRMYRNPDDTITRAELKRKLAQRRTYDGSAPVSFGGYFSLDNLVDDVISGSPRAKTTAPYQPDETLTLSELEAAFKRHGYADFSTPHHLQNLWDDIKDHREPEWEVGDIVTSATKLGYIRTARGWTNFSRDIDYDFNRPKRPLKKIGRVV